MKKRLPFYFLALLICLVGCSSNSKSESSDNSSSAENAKMNLENSIVMDSAQAGMEQKSAIYSGEKDKADTSNASAKIEVPNQMVIYQADLQLRVKNFDKTVQSLEEKAVEYGGYIAESNVTKEGKELDSGSIKIRVPQRHFQDFLHDAEGQAAEVMQRNITGQDVTEEYVDLASRLKSKKVVEDRLLSFMKSAVKTEDLLKISSDLAAVQQDIELIEGKMKFLENQTSLSTVNITLYENKVVVPNIDKEKLNTWEKTKKQFMRSTNMLLSGFSGLIVLIFGNLPILIILALIAFVGFLFIKRKKGSNSQD